LASFSDDETRRSTWALPTAGSTVDTAWVPAVMTPVA
jgi:hypothetical protein